MVHVTRAGICAKEEKKKKKKKKQKQNKKTQLQKKVIRNCVFKNGSF